MPSAALDDAPRVLQERYRIDRLLGQGGMGSVYQGVDLFLQRPIAVKLITPDHDPDEDAVQRFLREVRFTAKVQHQHIIKVYDGGRTAQGELYFVMELLEGESLGARLRREDVIPPDGAVPIVAQICQALDVSHAAGIVHRDLKPANVMLIRRPGSPVFVKLIDFGISKSTSSEGPATLTKTGALVGTIGYMAPEQLAGQPVDGRTDIYAIGVLLYRMLTGTPLFAEQGPVVAIHNHMTVAPEPMRHRVADARISPMLDAIVLRCLAKSPKDRFQTVRELEIALRRAVAPDAAAEEVESGTRRVVPAVQRAGDEARIDPSMPVEPTTSEGMSEAQPFELAEHAHASTTPFDVWSLRLCGSCQRENRRYARVCDGCGAALDAVEPSAPSAPLVPPMAASLQREETTPWGRPQLYAIAGVAVLALVCTLAIGWPVGLCIILFGSAGVAVWARLSEDRKP
jgi:serine/threonine protein kinase